MGKCVGNKNPLKHDGTSQGERLLPAMKADYVNADEKTFADWIVFANEYSAFINFYECEVSGARTGDWRPFFESDVLSVLGTVCIQDVDLFRRDIFDKLQFLRDINNVTSLGEAKTKLNDLFSLILSFCDSLDSLSNILPVDIQLKKSIENSINSSLAPSLKTLIKYYKAAVKLDYLQTGNLRDWKVVGKQIKDVRLITEGSGLSKLWWCQSPVPELWKDYYTTITEDYSIFGNEQMDLYFNQLYSNTDLYSQSEWLQFMKMNHASNHNLFNSILNRFLAAFSKIVKDAEAELLLLLESQRDHPPHYILFLTFLRLFRIAQKDLNSTTQRHLDFYYREILKLKQIPAMPDNTHILAELSKPADSYIMPAGTLFKAGKDSAGRDVLYNLPSETTFNKAKISSLRSVYFAPAESSPTDTGSNLIRIYAAPMINSGDGVSSKLTSPNKEWHPFANSVYSEGELAGINMPFADIGFAVASHYLFLQEGSRHVTLKLGTSNNDALSGKKFSIYLTTSKGWFKLPVPLYFKTESKVNGSGTLAVLSFNLNGGDPPIISYDVKLHGCNLNVHVPVLRVILLNSPENSCEYKSLENITVSTIQISVGVGISGDEIGLKQLQVQTDTGTIDTSKPFAPFGVPPRKGACLILGSRELFFKKGAKIKLNIDWANYPENNKKIKYKPQSQGHDTTVRDYLYGLGVVEQQTLEMQIRPTLEEDTHGTSIRTNTEIPDFDLFFLDDGIWEPSVTNFGLLESASLHSEFFNLLEGSFISYDEFYGDYQTSSSKGFFKLVLNDDFGFKDFFEEKMLHMIEISKQGAEVTQFSGVEPYIPVIQSISLGYDVSTEIVDLTSSDEGKYKNRQLSFFHIYPFGDAEQHCYLDMDSTRYLFPQFSHKNTDGILVPHTGEFYLGLKELSALQSVNILFQVMDGSADPLISKPPEHIFWSYISNNSWKNFKNEQVIDSTGQLIRSGIISFIIPSDATTDNSLMPSGHIWIKASVSKEINAVCKLISVDAQAARLTFYDQQNDEDRMRNRLLPGSINKLAIPASEIKKINQPYSSFGGRASESAEAFYKRVSERLRHKSRASSVWDYEHLVLQEFPQIYKIKCLNHTKCEDGDYNELMPGHVTMIAIPDLHTRNDANPLKPYSSQNLLEEIKSFLQVRISGHVKLHVCNPDFEGVRISFGMKLVKGYNDFEIYKKLLQEEITSFLSPWAYGSAELGFGGKVTRAVIIRFIEERPFVDFITDVHMSHYNADGGLIRLDNDEITPATARSILVSVKASSHEIHELNEFESAKHYECTYLKEKKRANRNRK